MYRTYEVPKDKPFVIGHFDGDCSYYTVCEDQKEYDNEKERLRKIDEDYKRTYSEYLSSTEYGH